MQLVYFLIPALVVLVAAAFVFTTPIGGVVVLVVGVVALVAYLRGHPRDDRTAEVRERGASPTGEPWPDPRTGR